MELSIAWGPGPYSAFKTLEWYTHIPQIPSLWISSLREDVDACTAQTHTCFLSSQLPNHSTSSYTLERPQWKYTRNKLKYLAQLSWARNMKFFFIGKLRFQLHFLRFIMHFCASLVLNGECSKEQKGQALNFKIVCNCLNEWLFCDLAFHWIYFQSFFIDMFFSESFCIT